MAKETAEQKLLKLIETTNAAEAAQTPSPQAQAQESLTPAMEAQKTYDSVKSVGLPSIPLPPILVKIFSILRNPAEILTSAKQMTLRDVNSIILILIFITFFILNLNIGTGLKLSKTNLAFQVESQISDISENLFPDFKTLKHYSQVIKRRNIFQPYEPNLQVIQEELPEQLKGMAKVGRQFKDFRLVGISWLDSPESASAMIENTENGVTYFLKQGEDLNNVMIKEIYSNSIVISFDGEQMELRL